MPSRPVPAVDLHVHSTASDGSHTPDDVVRCAAAAGLSALALTDHDTVAGVRAAQAAGASLGVRVVAGCEFSVAVPWGEMHLLAYFLPLDDPTLDAFLDTQRLQRAGRMQEIVRRLQAAGAALTASDVEAHEGNAALGRPHAARALVSRGVVRDMNEAFDRFLGKGRPAYVPKRLPAAAVVTRLVRGLGGVTAAAHLKDRATGAALARLREMGVDGLEVRHPAHDPRLQERLVALAREEGFLPTGGTDWHGEDEAAAEGRAALGTITVPMEWLEAMEQLHERRLTKGSS